MGHDVDLPVRKEESTLLEYAIEHGSDVACVELLLDANAEVRLGPLDAPGNHKELLQLAARNPHMGPQIVELLAPEYRKAGIPLLRLCDKTEAGFYQNSMTTNLLTEGHLVQALLDFGADAHNSLIFEAQVDGKTRFGVFHFSGDP